MPIPHLLPSTWIVSCPRCNAQIHVRRSLEPYIDSAGFESYALACSQCEIQFSGIIDPYDDAFLADNSDLFEATLPVT